MTTKSQRLIDTDKKKMEKDLRQKMAQSVAGSAPSMVPVPYVKQGKVPKHEQSEAIPPVEDLITDKEDRETLAQLVAARVQLDIQLKPLEKQKEMMTDRIKAALSSYGITSMMCAGAKVSYTQQEYKKLNEQKLIGAGVDLETIILCTDVTMTSRLTIRPEKD